MSRHLLGMKEKQRCLWHIPHQAKYALWKDKVKHNSPEWLNIIAELIEVCAIRPLVDCPDTTKAMIRSKNRRLRKIIKYCEEKNFKHTAFGIRIGQPVFLKNHPSGTKKMRAKF
jgi:hypothetical protein